MFRAEFVKRKGAYFAPFVFVQKSCGCWDNATSEKEGTGDVALCALPTLYGSLLIYTVGSVKYATVTSSPP
jgi:hypothetical protein